MHDNESIMKIIMNFVYKINIYIHAWTVIYMHACVYVYAK